MACGCTAILGGDGECSTNLGVGDHDIKVIVRLHPGAYLYSIVHLLSIVMVITYNKRALIYKTLELY